MSLLKNKKWLNCFQSKARREKLSSSFLLHREWGKKRICQASLEKSLFVLIFVDTIKWKCTFTSWSEGKTFLIFLEMFVHNQFHFNGFTFSLEILLVPFFFVSLLQRMIFPLRVGLWCVYKLVIKITLKGCLIKYKFN